MKHTFPICCILFLALNPISAQVASHAPTVFKQPAAATAAPKPGSETVLLQPTGKPVARVNDTILTDIDLTREEFTIFPYGRQHNGLPKEMEPGIRKGALEMIIFEELVYQEALRRKMTIPAAKLQKAEADFHKQFATPEEYNAFVQSEFKGSEKLVEDKIRRSLLIEALLKLEVEDKSKVTPAEIREFYNNYPGRFEHGESFTFQTITVLPPQNATADQLKEGQKRIQQTLPQAKATKSAEEFGLLAEKVSDDDYRVMMGQHKPMAAKDLAPQVLAALRTMKPGDVSDVIQIEQAYTILRLNEHTPAGKAKFEDVKDGLMQELQKKKNNQLRADLDKKLRESAKVAVL
jgi:parvulin-like peptidyl-prolyl isomerase